MLTERTRELLQLRIDALEAECHELRGERDLWRTRHDGAAADNERLRSACRMILDRARPIASVHAEERDVGVAAYFSRAEYAIVVSAAGGYPDVPGERAGAGADATVRTAWGPVEVGE